jgi:hypothetical protein
MAVLAVMPFDALPWIPTEPPVDFNHQRKLDTSKGGERAQFKAERERAKFPRKRK